MTRKQKISSFKLSFALALLDSLKQDEKPKGRLWNRISCVEESTGKLLDEYRIEKFHRTDLTKAGKLFDFMEQKIDELYPV